MTVDANSSENTVNAHIRGCLLKNQAYLYTEYNIKQIMPVLNGMQITKDTYKSAMYSKSILWISTEEIHLPVLDFIVKEKDSQYTVYYL